jgi:hypothetical protein
LELRRRPRAKTQPEERGADVCGGVYGVWKASLFYGKKSKMKFAVQYKLSFRSWLDYELEVIPKK